MRVMLTVGMMSLATAAGTAGLAKESLRNVPSVWTGLLNVGIANEIRETCPTISAKVLPALARLNGIERDAKSRGYSQEEIDAFTDNAAYKAEMRAQGEAYMKENGVVKGDTESYCALGRAEIAKSSQIGTLLRAR